MDNGEMSPITATLHHLLSIPRFLGTFPINQNGEFVPYRLIFLFATCIAYIYFSDVGLLIDLNLSSLMFVTSILLPIIHVVCLYTKIYHMKEVYSKFSHIGKYYRSIDVEYDFSYKWKHKYLNLLLILQVFVTGVYMYPNEARNFLIQFMWTYISIYSLYDQIFSFLAVTANSIVYLKYITDNRELLKKKEILTYLCKPLEKVFSLQILCSMGITFFYCMIYIYITFEFGPRVIYVPVITLLGFPLIRMITSVNYVMIEAKKIDKLLYRRLLDNPDDKMLEFHMIAKRDVTFTALGFFQINSSLIGSMIAVGTTYLVILLQYVK
ncbi:unnamed protein product [Nezara viridula]|uniref:Gustatory receptor n=1 Tax=Nezara viridula TaxID=85310 RepID=A0A9P0HEX4_NEZVI|nr:unnamed protein product [Nezara viridula]